VARGIFGNIFENLRASCKYVGCGLILEKMRCLSAKCWEMGFSRNYFVEEKPVNQVHRSVDHASPVNHGPAWPPPAPMPILRVRDPGIGQNRGGGAKQCGALFLPFSQFFSPKNSYCDLSILAKG
jgi:hypothetical protein